MELFEKFLEYLKKETVIVENENGVEFQLPFLDLRNDYICLCFDKKTQELSAEVNDNLLKSREINSDNFGEIFLKLLQEAVVVNGLINFHRYKLPQWCYEKAIKPIKTTEDGTVVLPKEEYWEYDGLDDDENR